MIFLETFLVNLIKSQRIFAIICYYLKYLVSKFRILVHKRTILAWKLIFCSTLSTFRPKCPKTNGYNQTKNKLSLIIYFGNPKFWKCLGYSYDWLSIPPLDKNLLFRTFVHWFVIIIIINRQLATAQRYEIANFRPVGVY